MHDSKHASNQEKNSFVQTKPKGKRIGLQDTQGKDKSINKQETYRKWTELTDISENKQ